MVRIIGTPGGDFLVANNNINIDDDLGLDDRPARKPRLSNKGQRTEYLGGLHKLLTRGLPDLVDDQGILDVKRLSDHLGISFQAVYKFFEKDRIPTKRIATVLALSKSQKKKVPVGFKPLVRDDFWEFISK